MLYIANFRLCNHYEINVIRKSKSSHFDGILKNLQRNLTSGSYLRFPKYKFTEVTLINIRDVANAN